MKPFREPIIKFIILFFVGTILALVSHKYIQVLDYLIRLFTTPSVVNHFVNSQYEIYTLFLIGLILIVCWLTYLVKIWDIFIHWLYQS